MPNAAARASAQVLPQATNGRAVLGGILIAGDIEPELQALITAWEEAHRRLEETYDASCAAEDRARCPVPQALVATQRDHGFWSEGVPGRQYQARDVTQFRTWKALSAQVRFDEIFSFSGYDDRLAEIDEWQAEQTVANAREGVAAAVDLWKQAVENYHAMGARVAKLPAKTMAGVIAKLLAAAPHATEDDLEDPTSSSAVLASAALDALALSNAVIKEARS